MDIIYSKCHNGVIIVPRFADDFGSILGHNSLVHPPFSWPNRIVEVVNAPEGLQLDLGLTRQ